MSIESSIAFRYMGAKRKENFISFITIISIGGVGLGVAALIVVLAVLSGFESSLKEKFLGITSHVVVMRYGQGITDWPEVVKKIKTVPGVKSAEPFVYGQLLATGPGGASGVFLKGIDPQLTAADGQLAKVNLSLGAMENLNNPEGLEEPPIILGRDLAVSLGLSSYEHVRVISPFGRVTPLGNRMPATKNFQVAGTFFTGLYEYDSNMAYMTIPEAQKILAMDNEVTTVELMLDDIYKAEVIGDKVVELLGPEYWASTWMQRNLSLFAALKLEQTAMFVVLTLIIIVASFTIVATLIMMVKEKTRDIAILKSMGATRKLIRRIFVIQGMVVGVVGALGGLVVGVTLCLLLKRYEFISLPADVYLMSSLPVEMRPEHILATLVVTLAISFLATIYPSSQAARLDPVEALRYE